MSHTGHHTSGGIVPDELGCGLFLEAIHKAIIRSCLV